MPPAFPDPKLSEKRRQEQEDEEMDRAYQRARQIVWRSYSDFMGWDAGMPVKAVEGGGVRADPDEMERRRALFRRDWDGFGRWRAGRKRELQADGKRLEPIYVKDRATGAIAVKAQALLKQFGEFLGFLAAERRRRKLEKQREEMMAEWERAGRGGKGLADDD